MSANYNIDQTTNANNVSSQEKLKTDQQHLVNVQITNENVALNVMVGFLVSAQKRGAFNFQESAKLWECIKIFQKSEETHKQETHTNSV